MKSGKTAPCSNPTPIQNAAPTMTPLRASMPSCTTILMPTVKMEAMVSVMNVAVTGPGTASTTARAFGRHASARNATPAAMPTVLAPIPVVSTIAAPFGRAPTGIVPASAESRLPAGVGGDGPLHGTKVDGAGPAP